MSAKAELITEDAMRERLSNWVSHRESRSAAARELGISRSHLTHILAGRKDVGTWVAEQLGWRYETIYRRQR